MDLSIICTQNVRSIATSLRLADFERSVSKLKFEIFGLAETRRASNECIQLASGHILYNSGFQAGNNTTHAGVGFYIPKHLDKHVEGVYYVNDRIIQMIVKGKGNRKIRLIQIHAPHSGHDEDTHEAFSEALEHTLQGRYTYDFLFGDFNSIVGAAQPGENCCGKFGIGVRNDRGESLVNFCEAYNWSIMNTFFKKRRQRKWTWRSPNGQTLNEIDYFLAKVRSQVKDVTALSHINNGSDHRILRMITKMPESTLCRKAKSHKLAPIFNNLKLQVEMALQWQQGASKNYTDLVKTIARVTQLSAETPRRTPRISNRTKELMVYRNKLKFGVNNGITTSMEYNIVCKTVRWSLNDDLKRHHVDVLEKAIRSNRLKLGRRELAYHRKQISQVRRTDGSITTNIPDTIQVTASFYSNLYTSTAGHFTYNITGPLLNPITATEIRHACNKIRGNTSPGIDGISSKASKFCLPIASEDLARYLNQMFENNNFPSDLVHAKNILLHKKGDSLDLNNYRPISLLSNVYKVLTRVLTHRVQQDVANKIPVEQAGFRRSYSTIDHILTINLLMEKCREWNLPLHIAFIDFKKAFDSIEFEAIWLALNHFNVNPETIRMIKQLYSASKSSVVIANKSCEFNIQRGVRQGDSLSPLLFVLTLQLALNRISWHNRGYPINDKRLQHLDYADDIALISKSVNDLQTMLTDLVNECREIGLEININKTKWISTSNGMSISIDRTNIQQVDSFIYLGQYISQPRDHGKEVSRRIGAAWANFGKVQQLLTSKRTPMDIKRRYFQQCIVPTLLYGCESWALTKAMEFRLTRCQRAMEQRLLNITLTDRRHSTWIRQKTKLPDIVEAYRKRKWKHVCKVVEHEQQNRWDWQLLNWTPKAKRPLGRPRTRWSDCFKKTAGNNWLQKVNTQQWKDLLSSFITVSND